MRPPRGYKGCKKKKKDFARHHGKMFVFGEITENLLIQNFLSLLNTKNDDKWVYVLFCDRRSEKFRFV